MDETLRNSAAGRDAVVPDAGNDPAASHDSASARPGPAGDVVTICAWCPQLHILSLQRRDVDVISTVQFEKKVTIFRNGKEMKVSHGICAPCRERLYTQKDTTFGRLGMCGDSSGPSDSFCVLESGHPGDHKQFYSSGGCIGWANKVTP